MIGYFLLLHYNRFGFLFGINSVYTSMAMLLKQNGEIKYFLLSSNKKNTESSHRCFTKSTKC